MARKILGHGPARSQNHQRVRHVIYSIPFNLFIALCVILNVTILALREETRRLIGTNTGDPSVNVRVSVSVCV